MNVVIRFVTVLVHGIPLRIPAQMDTFLKRIEIKQMLFPTGIDDLQIDHTLEEPQMIRAQTRFAFRVFLLGCLEKPADQKLFVFLPEILGLKLLFVHAETQT